MFESTRRVREGGNYRNGGPDDARRVVWSLGTFLLILTNDFFIFIGFIDILKGQ